MTTGDVLVEFCQQYQQYDRLEIATTHRLCVDCRHLSLVVISLSVTVAGDRRSIPQWSQQQPVGQSAQIHREIAGEMAS